MSKLLNSDQAGHYNGFRTLKQRRLDVSVAQLMESEASKIILEQFDVDYHIKILKVDLRYNYGVGAEFHLRQIIRLTEKKIMEDHCE